MMSTIMQPVGLFRLLAAIFYDGMLLIATFFFATAILLPFAGGEAIQSNNFFYFLYLLLVSFIFYAWFWRHGGQTLGMQAWRIKLSQHNGQPITWRQASFRFMAAILSWLCLGCGFLWIIVDKNQQSWHDKLSNTHLQHLPK